MRFYIAGKMTGIPEFNFPEFFRAERTLSRMGYDFYNPARADGINTKGMIGDLSEVPEFCLRKAMKRNCHAIADCDGIYMLSGWEYSKGATVEHQLAVYLGLAVLYQGKGE